MFRTLKRMLTPMKASTKALLVVLIVVILAGASLLIWGLKTGKLKSSASIVVGQRELRGQAYLVDHVDDSGKPIAIAGPDNGRVGVPGVKIWENKDYYNDPYSFATTRLTNLPYIGWFTLNVNVIFPDPGYELNGECYYYNVDKRYYCPQYPGTVINPPPLDENEQWTADLPYFKQATSLIFYKDGTPFAVTSPQGDVHWETKYDFNLNSINYATVQIESVPTVDKLFNIFTSVDDSENPNLQPKAGIDYKIYRVSANSPECELQQGTYPSGQGTYGSYSCPNQIIPANQSEVKIKIEILNAFNVTGRSFHLDLEKSGIDTPAATEVQEPYQATINILKPKITFSIQPPRPTLNCNRQQWQNVIQVTVSSNLPKLPAATYSIQYKAPGKIGTNTAEGTAINNWDTGDYYLEGGAFPFKSNGTQFSMSQYIPVKILKASPPNEALLYFNTTIFNPAIGSDLSSHADFNIPPSIVSKETISRTKCP